MNKNAKIGIAVGLLVLAGVIFYMTAGSSNPEDESARAKPDDVQMVDLVCVDSGKHVQLPATQVDQKPIKLRGGRPSRGNEDKQLEPPTKFECSECESGEAILAVVCPQCNRFIARQKMDGSPNECPECGFVVGN